MFNQKIHSLNTYYTDFTQKKKSDISDFLHIKWEEMCF